MALQPIGSPRGKRRSRPGRVKAERGSMRIAQGLYQELRKVLGPMLDEMMEMAPWLASNPGVMVAMQALNEQAEKWRRVLGPSLRGIAGRWAATTSERDKEKLQASLAKALGVQAVAIFDEQPVQDVVELMGVEATRLISSIPEAYHAKVQEMVMKSYQQQELPEGRGLIAEIRELGVQEYERAKLIAVDQTNKMHSMVTQARQQSMGIEEYIWRTARDSRVVGTPGGLYPKPSKLHGDHFAREGKKFRWDEPPSDGHPGWPIRCRCAAEPVVDYDKLILS